MKILVHQVSAEFQENEIYASRIRIKHSVFRRPTNIHYIY